MTRISTLYWLFLFPLKTIRLKCGKKFGSWVLVSKFVKKRSKSSINPCVFPHSRWSKRRRDTRATMPWAVPGLKSLPAPLKSVCLRSAVPFLCIFIVMMMSVLAFVQQNLSVLKCFSEPLFIIKVRPKFLQKNFLLLLLVLVKWLCT